MEILHSRNGKCAFKNRNSALRKRKGNFPQCHGTSLFPLIFRPQIGQFRAIPRSALKSKISEIARFLGWGVGGGRWGDIIHTKIAVISTLISTFAYFLNMWCVRFQTHVLLRYIKKKKNSFTSDLEWSWSSK